MPDMENTINKAFNEDKMDMLEMVMQKDLERFHSIPEQTGADLLRQGLSVSPSPSGYPREPDAQERCRLIQETYAEIKNTKDEQ